MPTQLSPPAPGQPRSSAVLLVIPSAYGLGAWVAVAIMTLLDPLGLVEISFTTWGVIFYIGVLFVLSTLINYNKAQGVSLSAGGSPIEPTAVYFFFFTAIIGAWGLWLYIRDFAAFFGGIDNLVFNFFNQSLAIRAAGEDVDSLGFQISYFSWIAIFFAVFIGTDKNFPFAFRLFTLTIAAVFFVLNLGFIDRTRPTWLIITCALPLLISQGGSSIRAGRVLFWIAIAPIVLFFAFAIFSSKFDASTGLLHSLFVYLLSGFAYLDNLISTQSHDFNFTLIRTFLPISKALELIGLVENVPSEVLPFRAVPYETNVGTFLEPLYSDGGIWYLLAAAPLLIWVVDRIALSALGDGSLLGKFVWANMVFASLLCFFSSKWTSTAVYLFVILFIVQKLAFAATHSPGHRPLAPA